jgi:Tfp pilus assembly protein PilF
MPTDRIQQLEKFYEDDPHDPFNVYALALEYLKYDATRSQALFEMLLRDSPQYLPTYYHAAKFFGERGQKERAVEIFENGIALAKKVNDAKALRELRSALDELMFE